MDLAWFFCSPVRIGSSQKACFFLIFMMVKSSPVIYAKILLIILHQAEQLADLKTCFFF